MVDMGRGVGRASDGCDVRGVTVLDSASVRPGEGFVARVDLCGIAKLPRNVDDGQHGNYSPWQPRMRWWTDRYKMLERGTISTVEVSIEVRNEFQRTTSNKPLSSHEGP